MSRACIEGWSRERGSCLEPVLRLEQRERLMSRACVEGWSRERLEPVLRAGGERERLMPRACVELEQRETRACVEAGAEREAHV